MKDFLKYTMATICGILLLTIAGFIIFAITLAGIAASGSATTQVQANSVFVLKLDGIVTERAMEDDPLTVLLGEFDVPYMGLDDIVASIKKAKENDDIKGIYIENGVATFDGPASAQQVRDALVDFKKSGKWVIAFADNYTQAGYYVASAADSVFLNKTGIIELKGLGGKSQYMTGLYEKLGVKYQPIRVGKYKSAVESVTRKNMSEEDREQREAFLNSVWQHWLSDIASSRKVTAAGIDQLVSDSILTFANPQDYVDSKLVDRLIYPDAIKKIVNAKLGLSDDDDVNQLMLEDMVNVPTKERQQGEEIAVYYAYGEILDQQSSYFVTEHNIIGNETVEDLNELADDDDVKAVVLRVNSPGGSAVASEQIWHAVKQLRAKKPVVVSMGSYAASGGYYISAAANYIFAEPTTITGSIGIFGLVPNLTGLVTDKLGVTFDGAKTNRYTDFEENMIFSRDNDAELKFLQTYVDRGYETFLGVVADGRGMTRDQVHDIAQGRVWVATDALNIKLIDQLGSLDDAVKKAAELAKVGAYHQTSYPEPADWFEQMLDMEDKGSYLDGELREVLGDLYQPFIDMRRDQQRNRLQVRLPVAGLEF